MQHVKIISVSSLAAHKTASIKAQISILGSAVLPVPTIVLNGVTSFSQINKQTIDFRVVLEGTMKLCIQQNHKVFIFIGYVTSSEDIYTLLEFINKYKSHLAGVFVDPISGDQDKTYIDQKIIDAWPLLIALSDFVFPNQTELKLYSGLGSEEKSLNNHIKAFERRFPKPDYIITSYKDKKYGVLLKYGSKKRIFNHTYYNVKIDGAGDVFASYFLKYYLLAGYRAPKSCSRALKKTLRLMNYSFKNNESELVI